MTQEGEWGMYDSDQRPCLKQAPRLDLTNRHGLVLGGISAPLITALMWLTAPIALPVSWVLDALVPTGRKAALTSSPSRGDSCCDEPASAEEMEGLLGGRDRLKAILSVHGGAEAGTGDESLRADEARVGVGFLDWI